MQNTPTNPTMDHNYTTQQQEQMAQSNIPGSPNAANTSSFNGSTSGHVQNTVNIASNNKSEQNNLTVSTAVGVGDATYFQQMKITTTHGTNIEQHVAQDQTMYTLAHTASTHVRTVPDPENISSSTAQSKTTRNKANSSTGTTKSRKRSSRSGPVTPRVSTKRAKKNQKQIACQNAVDNLDNKMLLDVLSKKLEPKIILEKYREKTESWTENRMLKQLKGVLNFEIGASSNSTTRGAKTLGNSKNLHENPLNSMSDAKTSDIQSILKGISNLAGDNFIDTFLNTFDDNLIMDKLLMRMTNDVLTAALRKKLTMFEVLDTFKINKQDLLKTATVDEILNLVQSRDDLKASMPLLQLLLKGFSQDVPQETDSNTLIVKSESDIELADAIVNLIKTRKFLKNSEALFNYVLKNGPEKLSEKSKDIIKYMLINKFKSADLAKLALLHIANEIVVINDD